MGEEILSFKPVHIFMFFAPMLFIFKEFRDSLRVVVKKTKGFHIVFAFLFLSYAISLFWTSQKFVGVGILARHLSFYLFFLIFTTCVIECLKRKEQVFLSIAAVSGVLFYFLFLHAAYYFSEGTFFLKEVFSMIAEGDHDSLRKLHAIRTFSNDVFGEKNIIPRIYNGNRISAGLLLLFIVKKIFEKKTTPYRIFGALIDVLIIFLIAITFSRSGLLVLTLVFIAIFLLKAFYQPKKYLGRGLFVLSISLIFFSLVKQPTSNVLDTLLYRVYNTSINSEIRLVTYKSTLEKIRLKPFTGYGLGKKIEERPNSDFYVYVHNFVLGSWYMSGILGLLASIIFMFYLAFFYLKKIPRFLKKEHTLSKGTIWFIALPWFLIVNFMFAGSNGNLAIVAWSHIGLIIAYCFIYLENPKETSESTE